MSTPYGPPDPAQQQPGTPGAYSSGPYPPQGGYPPPPPQDGGYTPYPPQSPYGQGPYGQGPYGQGPYGQQRDYLHGGPVGFGAAISEAFRNMINYQGRASRSAYWWFTLFQALVEIALVIIAISSQSLVLIVVLYLVILIFSLLVGLPLTVRRLHDQDKSGFWYFITFVPFIGGIWLLVLMCLEGTPGPNRFG